ncbi:MAG: transporter [Candidatus Riflebacteria bacterium]|nr:transporter [Candidatus Riflebacteria bacterium]
MAFLHDLFAHSPPLRIFTIIGLGYFLGHIRIRGCQLNVAAVLFVGLAFGIWDAQAFALPEPIYVLGLMLFVYSVGLQSGPVFVRIFRERGFKVNVLAVSALAFSFVLTIVLGRGLGIPSGMLAGVYAGALTNTSSLAAATDCVREQAEDAGWPADLAARRISAPTLGYSICYPFGSIGVILCMQMLAWLLKVPFREEREAFLARSQANQNLLVKPFRITNPALFGRKVEEAKLTTLTGLVFTRLQHAGAIALVTPESLLQEQDVIVGVGTAESVGKASTIVGPVEENDQVSFSRQLENRDLVVTNKAIVGTHVWQWNFDHGFKAVISRVRRGSTTLPIDHTTTLEFGDQIRVVTYPERMEQTCALFGNPVKDLSETDFLSVSLGLILGILLGMVPIPLPNGTVLRLGFAGGPLIVALLLGYLGRSGPIIWTMPVNANLTLRQLGLHLFLAGIGIKAGGGFLAVFQAEGLRLFAAGAVLTLATAAFTLLVGYLVLRIEMIALLGITSGVFTQPASLVFAGELSESEAPNHYFAAIQPLAMIVKIIGAQMIVLFF